MQLYKNGTNGIRNTKNKVFLTSGSRGTLAIFKKQLNKIIFS